MKMPFMTALVLLSLSSLAQANPITFDDLTTNTGISSITGIPNGYQGLNWYNFYVAAGDAYPGSTFVNGVVSGNYAALDGYGVTPATISSPTPFKLVFANLIAQWDATDIVEVQGYLAGNPIFDITVNISANVPAGPADFTAIDLTPVDTVNFSIIGDPINDNFVVDNLTIASVPEPASLTIFSLGTLTLLRRRSRKVLRDIPACIQ